MSFIFGLILGTIAVAAIVLQGGSPVILFDLKALVLIVCGMLASLFITLPFHSVRDEIRVVLATLRPVPKAERLITEILELAKIARKEGILALEGLEKTISDSILKKGIVLISESADHETLKSILNIEAECLSRREKSAQKYIEQTAVFTIGIGMVGTLVEIVQMFFQYNGPKALAPEIARALLPVVYGTLCSYLVLLPLSARVREGSERRRLRRELAIEGVLAIQAGEPLHIVEERLKAFMSTGFEDKR